MMAYLCFIVSSCYKFPINATEITGFIIKWVELGTDWIGSGIDWVGLFIDGYDKVLIGLGLCID